MTQAIANIDSKSVNSTLTRRAALVGAACLAAPASAAAVCIAPGTEGPDPVIRLCQAWREHEEWAQEQMRLYSETHDRIIAGMPLPDPLIVYGPEAEALRIRRPDYGHWQPPHEVIEPHLIKSALFYITPAVMRMTEEILPDGKIARTFVDLDEPDPLTETQQWEHDKLTRMLELSKEYRAEIDRRMADAGYPPDDEDTESDEMAARQYRIERAIRITPARTRAGLLAKINLYLSAPDRFEPTESGDCLALSIARDARRLLAQ